ncbi:hypothetical protein MMC07_004117 [Pseudocyphellaria aurata]|nr:hypothetical protein [Pseudocyphellaria aurata]
MSTKSNAGDGATVWLRPLSTADHGIDRVMASLPIRSRHKRAQTRGRKLQGMVEWEIEDQTWNDIGEEHELGQQGMCME